MLNIKEARWYKKALLIFTLVIMMVLMTGLFQNAYAARITLPNSNIIIPDSKMFKMSSTNYTAEWHGVSGKTLPGKYSVYKCLAVPIKTKTAAFTYTDFLDLTFTNAGEVNGRQVNVKVHFNSMTVSKRGGSSSGERSDNYMAVCYVTDYFLWMKGNMEDGAGYRAATTIDTTTTVYYADTGEVVDLPFFQAVQDLDAGASYYTEAWEAVSGYTGNYYTYPECNLSVSGNKFSSKKTAVGGNDSVVKAGLYATTGNGQFRSKFYEGNCATTVKITSQYKTGMIKAPTLSIDDSKIYEPGDEIVLNVSQKIGTLYADMFDAYTSFGISDDIPKGLTYESAKVYDGSGNDVTDQGTLDYDASTNTVTFTFDSSYIKDTAIYTGQEYVLKITTTADDIEKGMVTIPDTAGSNISGIQQATNEQQVRVGVPYSAEYKYVSGSNRKLPDFISTKSGDYAISDDAAYYTGDTVGRKDAPADGTKHELYDTEGNYKGVWTLTWDKSSEAVTDHDVVFTGTWVYTPAPRINIVKVLDDEADLFTEAHGEPTFLFKVTGNDSGNIYYKSIRFTAEALEAVRGDGEYTDDTGTQFTVRDGKIYAMVKTFYVPEDDYIVEEVKTSRFEAEKAEARYHGDKAELIAQGKESVKVPLKLSEYKEGDAGYNADYASIMFENDKNMYNAFSHFDTVINHLK